MDDSIFERDNKITMIPRMDCARGDVVFLTDKSRHGIVLDDSGEQGGHTVYEILVGTTTYRCFAVEGFEGVVETVMERRKRIRLQTLRSTMFSKWVSGEEIEDID